MAFECEHNLLELNAEETNCMHSSGCFSVENSYYDNYPHYSNRELKDIVDAE